MIAFNSLAVVGAVAVVVPLIPELVPAIKVPPVVLEILGGVLVGPAVLGWVHLDLAVRVTSDLGLGYLLFLAGFEIDLRLFDRHLLSLVGRAFAFSAALALLVAYGLQLGGQIKDGLLVGITLMATALGVLVPILKDADETETLFGRLIMAAGSVAELVPLVLLSVFFSASSKDASAELGLLAGFVALTVVVVAFTQRVRGWRPLLEAVQRLENTSSQLRVRLAITLALAFGVTAEHFGLATILGAFLAGVIIRRTDESPQSHEVFQGKLEAIGFGFLIPVFFVSTGVGLDVTSLFNSTRGIVLLPVFLVAMLVVRGLPAVLYLRIVGRTRALAAGIMQGTSLPFIVVATTIGVQIGHQRPSTAAALVVAGLLSVVIYPPIALKVLKSARARRESQSPAQYPQPAPAAPAADGLAAPAGPDPPGLGPFPDEGPPIPL
jgi:Kef-type K+ transport system membrane component KefB